MESNAKEDIKGQGLVVRRPISVNPRLNFNPGSFFFCSKAFHQKFSQFFLEHSVFKLSTKRTKLNFPFKLSDLNLTFALTQGYLNPALHNPAQEGRLQWMEDSMVQGGVLSGVSASERSSTLSFYTFTLKLLTQRVIVQRKSKDKINLWLQLLSLTSPTVTL